MVPHPLIRFFLELKRRRVVRVAIGYAVAACAVMQVVSVVFPALHFSDWTVTFVVVVCLAGFPVALVLAWAFDLAPGWRRRVAAGVAALVLAAAAGTLWLLPARGAAVATRETPLRLAVLYFDDRTPDRSLGYLADGVTEELIDRFSEVPALNVVSRNGVAPFRRDTVALDSIARVLHAALLVSGTVARSNDSVRVSAELSDSNGTVLSFTSLDRPWSGSFALVDDVVHQVSNALRAAAGDEVDIKRWRAGTASEDAWRGLQLARSQRNDMEQMIHVGELAAGIHALEHADTVLARAERLDPHWVEPVIQRAWNASEIALLTRLLPGGRPAGLEALRGALRHADRAVALAPRDGRALEVRGVLRHNAARELPMPRDSSAALTALAQGDLESAVAVDRLRARAWAALAKIRLAQARFGEARVAGEHAYAADAYLKEAPDIARLLFQSALELGDDGEARRWCAEHERLRLTARSEGAWPFAYCSLELLAWAEPAPARTLDPWPIVARARGDPPPIAAAVRPRLELLAAAVLAREGRADSARAAATRARAAAPGDPALDYLDAAVELRLGDRAAALANLRAFAAHGLPGSRQPVAGRMFARLRGDTAYEALLRSLP